MTTVFSTQSQGIGGTLKYRYSDFLVEEIQPNGKPCEIKRFFGDTGLDNATPIQAPEKPLDRAQSHLHCDLEKYNCDIPMALAHLSRFLHVSKKRVGYAGLKDKRAITCQRISLFDPDLKQLERFRSRMMDLRNFEWSDQRIEIGDLSGNRFTITIRNIDLGRDEIQNRINEFERQAETIGVANYFGEQRFGGIRQNTHLVGKLLLKGKLDEGILLYLTHLSEKESPELTEIRKKLAADHDFGFALKAFPQKYRFERAMLQHLHNNPNDYAGALQKLPKHLRYLFTHAWQSHLFNELLSKRMQSGIGLQPIPKDKIENGEIMHPLLGFDSILDEGKLGALEQEVLIENDFSLPEFKSTKIPEISSAGSHRQISVKPKNWKTLAIQDDEYFPGKQKATVSFELVKGTYATTVLNELMKN